MKNRYFLLPVAMFFMASFIDPAQASDSWLSKPYYLLKTGTYSVNLRGVDRSPEPVMSAGLLVGIGFGYQRDFGLELELDYGLVESEYRVGQSQRRVGLWTAGSYFSYRRVLSQDFYLKGKTGLVLENLSIIEGNSRQQVTSEGLSVGGGFGWLVHDLLGRLVTFEFQATQIEADVLSYQLGAHVRF